jgi:hypothetical protein
MWRWRRAGTAPIINLENSTTVLNDDTGMALGGVTAKYV